MKEPIFTLIVVVIVFFAGLVIGSSSSENSAERACLIDNQLVVRGNTYSCKLIRE